MLGSRCFRAGFERTALGIGFGLLLLGVAACGDDAPGADHAIRVETGRFFPKDLDIRPGETVEWTNILPRGSETVRTVTSGTGPTDVDAGQDFDATLQGFPPGEGVGERFTYKFEDPGVYPYYTRFPVGSEFGGTITVR